MVKTIEKKLYAEANHRYSITLNFDVRLYMYNYIIRCVETLLLTVRVVIIYFFFFFFSLTRYIASIKYVYNNIRYASITRICSKYYVCNAFLVCVCVRICPSSYVLLYVYVYVRISRSKVSRSFFVNFKSFLFFSPNKIRIFVESNDILLHTSSLTF